MYNVWQANLIFAAASLIFLFFPLIDFSCLSDLDWLGPFIFFLFFCELSRYSVRYMIESYLNEMDQQDACLHSRLLLTHLRILSKSRKI